MAFVVAPGRRVQQNRTIYTEGQIVPYADRALLEAGVLVEVPDEESDLSGGKQPDDSTEKLDINTATVEQLLALDYVGEATATRILEGLPYETLEQVQTASGLAKDKWKKLEPKLTVVPVV